MPKNRISQFFTIPRRERPQRKASPRFLLIGGLFLIFIIAGLYGVSLLTIPPAEIERPPTGAPPAIIIYPEDKSAYDINKPVTIGCHVVAGDPLREVYIRYKPFGRSWVILDQVIILETENALDYSFSADVTLTYKGEYTVYVYAETYLDVISDKEHIFDAHNPPGIASSPPPSPSEGQNYDMSYSLNPNTGGYIWYVLDNPCEPPLECGKIFFFTHAITRDYNIGDLKGYLDGNLVLHKTSSPISGWVAMEDYMPAPSQTSLTETTSHVFKVVISDVKGLSTTKETSFSITWNQRNSLSDDDWAKFQRGGEPEFTIPFPSLFLTITFIISLVFIQKKVRKR